MKVECEIDEVDLTNHNDKVIPGVRVTCGRCGHQTESFGQSESSIKRCFALLHEECPEGEENYYCADGE